MSLEKIEGLIEIKLEEINAKKRELDLAVVKAGKRLTLKEIMDNVKIDSLKRFEGDEINYGGTIELQMNCLTFDLRINKREAAICYGYLEIKKFKGWRIRKIYDEIHREICFCHVDYLDNLPF